MMLASTSLSSVVSLATSALRSSSSPRVRPEVEVLSTLTPLLSSPRFDVNKQNGVGDTLLHTAARNNHPRVIDLLLQRCPQLLVDVRNVGGFTPLDFAARSGNAVIMLALIAAGADSSSLMQPTQPSKTKVNHVTKQSPRALYFSRPCILTDWRVYCAPLCCAVSLWCVRVVRCSILSCPLSRCGTWCLRVDRSIVVDCSFV